MTLSNLYYSRIRHDIAEFIDQGNHKILEIGCGTGETLKYLKKQKKCNYAVGIDIHKPSIQQAKKYLDQAIHANIETLNLNLKKKSFDYIILADVLEHLVNPEKTIAKLKPYLTKNGCFIISVPNIRNIQILKNLIFKDEWQYQDKGILDRTHLRFFTKKSILQLLESQKLKITKIKTLSPELNKFQKLLNFLLFNQLKPFYTIQYLMKVKN
jgi:2-polyprenyl-3-methyl-5-hydroxy-6-metoxy-1,4-benzoquinol methylase